MGEVIQKPESQEWNFPGFMASCLKSCLCGLGRSAVRPWMHAPDEAERFDGAELTHREPQQLRRILSQHHIDVLRSHSLLHQRGHEGPQAIGVGRIILLAQI